jgi:hypothetical protein
MLLQAEAWHPTFHTENNFARLALDFIGAMMDWIIQNIEWLLSGVVVAVPLAIIGWIIKRKRCKQIQKQKGGNGSANIQAGGSIHVGGSINIHQHSGAKDE